MRHLSAHRLVVVIATLFAAATLPPSLQGQLRSSLILAADGAQRAIAASVAEARKQGWAVPIAVVDPGVPVVINGETVGAVGVSGMTAARDAQVAQAGVKAVQP